MKSGWWAGDIGGSGDRHQIIAPLARQGCATTSPNIECTEESLLPRPPLAQMHWPRLGSNVRRGDTTHHTRASLILKILPLPTRICSLVNKHKSCWWYEPGVCVVGTAVVQLFPKSKSSTMRGSLLECVAFCFPRKLRKQQIKKNNYKWKSEMFFNSLCCNVVTKHHAN